MGEEILLDLDYGFPDRDRAEQAYGTLLTSLAMFKALAEDTPRFRSAYSDVFAEAELDYQEQTGNSASDAAEWTNGLLKDYFSILQSLMFPMAIEIARAIEMPEPSPEMLIRKDFIRDLDEHMDMKEVMSELERILSREQ